MNAIKMQEAGARSRMYGQGSRTQIKETVLAHVGQIAATPAHLHAQTWVSPARQHNIVIRSCNGKLILPVRVLL